LVIVESITKFDHKSTPRHFPVLNRHRPFLEACAMAISITWRAESSPGKTLRRLVAARMTLIRDPTALPVSIALRISGGYV